MLLSFTNCSANLPVILGRFLDSRNQANKDDFTPLMQGFRLTHNNSDRFLFLLKSFKLSYLRTQAACDSFCVGEEITKEASQSLDTVPSGWVPGRFRLARSVISAVSAFSTGHEDHQDGHNDLIQGT